MIPDMPETRWATTIDGASIAYQDVGEGPITLVAVAGYISHLEVYWELPQWVAFMRRLARNMRVLFFDKRGVGMSDRLSVAPSLDIQMDDLRAVIDAAGVERVAILCAGNPGPATAAFFAATHPDRTLALWIDGSVHSARDEDCPWGISEEDRQRQLERLSATWGQDAHAVEFAHYCFGDDPGDAPFDDPSFLRWLTKLARFSATPTGIMQFERMWFETDVRQTLHTIGVPTAVAVHVREDEEHRLETAYLAGRIPGARLVEVPADWAGIFGDQERYVAALEGFLASVTDEEARLDRLLATVLFTDVVGSTQKAAELGDRRWSELLEHHNTLVRALLTRYRGQEVNTVGDGFLATFDGPARAVKCAQSICEGVRPLGLEVRAGCHTGEIELLGADVGGMAVHIGARVGALAGPSEVLVSSTVKDLVAGSGLAFADRGEHQLKGVPDTWHLYALVSDP
jgi:class 3 adenylate cyclase